MFWVAMELSTTAGGGNTGTLQLLWSKWELPRHTELLEIPEILHLPNAESP